eukprot:EG_transcript_25847
MAGENIGETGQSQMTKRDDLVGKGSTRFCSSRVDSQVEKMSSKPPLKTAIAKRFGAWAPPRLPGVGNKKPPTRECHTALGTPRGSWDSQSAQLPLEPVADVWISVNLRKGLLNLGLHQTQQWVV